MSWVPPKSPHNLLQEILWPDEWKILISCLLLNQTSRKQVDKVYQELFYNYPCAESMANADQNILARMLNPLGLYNRRSKALIRFSREYLEKDWKTAKDLYGCGKYADDTWRLFILGDWKNIAPQDHALYDYYKWLKNNE